jgi:hypothetical protein
VVRPISASRAAGPPGGAADSPGGAAVSVAVGRISGRRSRISHDFWLAADLISGEFSVAESGIFRIGLDATRLINH